MDWQTVVINTYYLLIEETEEWISMAITYYILYNSLHQYLFYINVRNKHIKTYEKMFSLLSKIDQIID